MEPVPFWVISEVEGFGRPHLDDLSDAELATLARGGDMAAFGELYRRQAPSIAAVARRVVSDPEVVADVVQETFGRAIERIDRLREPARVGPWLGAIARHVATDQLRARYRATLEDDRSLATRPDTRTGPDVETEHRAQLDAVTQGIALLSPGDAQAVTLCAHLGLTTDELAAALGVTSTAAKVRLHRARGRLERILAARPGGGLDDGDDF